jgi:hypothetical protein
MILIGSRGSGVQKVIFGRFIGAVLVVLAARDALPCAQLTNSSLDDLQRTAEQVGTSGTWDVD